MILPILLIFPRTGFKIPLAAETVSFWICIRAALFDFFSPRVVFDETPDTGGVDAEDVWLEADVVEATEVDEVEEAVEGSAVIRSINVVPEDSCDQSKARKVVRIRIL